MKCYSYIEVSSKNVWICVILNANIPIFEEFVKITRYMVYVHFMCTCLICGL